MQIKKEFSCNVCQKGFTQQNLLDAHVCTKNKPHKCEVCGKVYLASVHLHRHRYIHLGIKVEHTCKFCQKVFATKYSLKSHYRVHTGEKPFVCVLCQKAFTQKNNLDFHLRNHQEKQLYDLYECDFCPKAYSKISHLHAHLSSAHGK